MQCMQWKPSGGWISLLATSVSKVIHETYDDLMYWTRFCQITGLTVNMEKMKKENQCKCKSSSILVLMSHRQIGGVYTIILHFKKVENLLYVQESMQPKWYSRNGSNIDAVQCYGGPSVALWSRSVEWHYLTRENPENVLMKTIGVKSSSFPIMLLETGARPIEVLAMQRVYMYIKKIRNMLDHRFPKWSWNIGCKAQKTNINEILSSMKRLFK